MIPRSAEPRLKKLASQFPAVIMLGSRQCGKTTLARHFVAGRYFDLEKPSDLQVFTGDIEYALECCTTCSESGIWTHWSPHLRAAIVSKDS